MYKKSKIEITGNNQQVRTQLAGMETKEHDKIYSRTLRREVEIGTGIHPGTQKDGEFGGLVPPNPFASLAESRFAHANPSKFGGKAGLKEWDKSTDYSKIPKRVKKSKG
jgi:hypothetical protein